MAKSRRNVIYRPPKHYRRFFLKRFFKITLGEPSAEIIEAFSKYSEYHLMTPNFLLMFMTDYQKDSNATREDAQKIYNSLKCLNIFPHSGLNLEAFFRYLLCDLDGLNVDGFFRYLLSDLNIPLPSKVHQDMDAPLSHYFLYTCSCHNSDRAGNQPSRASTVDTIVKALKKGVRVIELELWPKPNRVGVDVRHGGALTSGEDLKKCLRAIKDNAFVASEYPILINFADLQALNRDLQDQVAKILTKTFGDMLYYPDYSNQLPSPNALKRKVLILIEPPTEYLEPDNDKQDGLDNGELIEEDEEEAAPEFKKLIALHTMKMKGRSDLWSKLIQNKVKRLSINQQQLEEAIQLDQKHTNTILRFTQWNILSIDPTELCFGSSNYNPFIGWRHGAQMVTLNKQGTRKYLRALEGMFRANGGCGYVKKPQYLLESPTFLQPLKAKLQITIFDGDGWDLDFHFATDYRPRVIIKIRINGVPGDEGKREAIPISYWSTQGWGERFVFELRYPELNVLHVKAVLRESSEKFHFGGQTSLPVSELKSGIRVVRLCDENGHQYKHTWLLVRFQIETLSNN